MNAVPTSQLVTTAHVQKGAPHISPQHRVPVCVILAMLSSLWISVHWIFPSTMKQCTNPQLKEDVQLQLEEEDKEETQVKLLEARRSKREPFAGLLH